MNDMLLHPPLDIAEEVAAILDEIDRKREVSAQESLLRPMYVCVHGGPNWTCGRTFTERPTVCDRCGHDHATR